MHLVSVLDNDFFGQYLQIILVVAFLRINLDLLRNPNDAVRIVKECQSKEGAKLVAGYAGLFIACICIDILLHSFFQKLGDISLALQFLILSGCQEDAFQIAEVSLFRS